MNKKGQSISINTIIVAAIALTVLVVLFAIFTGRLGIFSTGVKDTDTCAQKCNSLNLQPGMADSAATCTDRQYIPGKYGDVDKNKVCCCASP